MKPRQSSCKVTSVLSPSFSRRTEITAERHSHKTRREKSPSNFKLTTLRNPWTGPNSALVISPRTVSRRGPVFLTVKDMLGQTAVNSEGRRQVAEDEVTTRYPSIFSREEEKEARLPAQDLPLRIQSPADATGCFQSGALTNEAAVTLSSPTLGQLPCFSAGLQTCG